jgi:hypothetical protein
VKQCAAGLPAGSKREACGIIVSVAVYEIMPLDPCGETGPEETATIFTTGTKRRPALNRTKTMFFKILQPRGHWLTGDWYK